MSDFIRLDIAGKMQDEFQKASSQLIQCLVETVSGLGSYRDDEATREIERQLLEQLASIKRWKTANSTDICDPEGQTVLSIATRFEELKTSQAAREKQALDNEERRHDLRVKKLIMNLKILGLLTNNLIGNGQHYTLVLSKKDLAVLTADLTAMAGQQECV